MFIATYPATIVRENDAKGYFVRFADLPEALTGGDDLQDSLAQAADCLAEALAGRIRRGDPIPAPSKLKRGQHPIGVPPYLASKLAGPLHDTKPARIQAALNLLGKSIVVSFEDAA